MKLKMTTCLSLVGTVFLAACSAPAPPAPIKPGPPRTDGVGGASQNPPSKSVVKPSAAATPARSEKKIRAGQITGVEMGRLFTMIQTDRVMLVDCRPPLFFRMGHLDGAINLPLKNYDAVIRERKQHLDQALASNKIIVLYCQNTECPDAYGVAKKLIILGYSVSIYKGGWEEWKRAGL